MTHESPDGHQRRNGRLYLTGVGVSVLGNNALSLAAGIWVKSLTGSNALAALISVCVYAPSLLGPLAGLVADRVRKRRFLIGLNVASALVVLPLVLVERTRIWIVFAVMLWYGVLLVISAPLESALFAMMLPSNLRRSLNGWSLGLQEAGRLIAPLVGAGLFALAGGGTVAVFDSLTFLVAAVLTYLIRFHEEKPHREVTHWFRSLSLGLLHVYRTPQLRRVLVVGSVLMGFSAVLVAAQYAMVQGLGKSPAFLGVLSAALGAGSIVASLVSGRLLRVLGEGWVMVLGIINFVCGNALRALGVLSCAIAGSFDLGFALPWIFLALLSLSQRATPKELQGRVSAATTLVFFGTQAPLQAVGALLIEHLSYQVLYASGALGAAIIGLAFTGVELKAGSGGLRGLYGVAR